jgi:glutathionylspermidine synthase
MKRNTTRPRNNWQQVVEKIGFGFHTSNVPYWDESVYYSFSMNEVLQIEKATATLWDMCLSAVQYVIDKQLYAKFGIPDYIIPVIERSWNEDHPAIYGRFDLCYKNGHIKMLEFNADTPTSLFEAGVVQWYWLQDFDADKDQFNSIHEKLVDYWKYLKSYLYREPLYFSCMKNTLEDFTTTQYMRDCAIQGGLETDFIFLEEIGWDSERKIFVDNDEVGIKNIFKLYPWEMILDETFGPNIPQDKNASLWIEPSWKMLLSSKAILPILWKLFPSHELLLESYFEKNALMSFVEKPIWSREGSNILIYENGEKKLETRGDYGNIKSIYQELFTLPDFDGRYPVIGSWIIGQEPAGIGIRESDTLITTNTSRFVPHLIKEDYQ